MIPENAVLQEQKAQVLLEIGDSWNALKAATREAQFLFHFIFIFLIDMLRLWGIHNCKRVWLWMTALHFSYANHWTGFWFIIPFEILKYLIFCNSYDAVHYNFVSTPHFPCLSKSFSITLLPFGVLELFIIKLREPSHTYVKFLSCRSCWIGAIMGWGMSYIYASSFIAPHVLTCLQILSYDASFTILKIMKKKAPFLICLLNI